MSATDTRYVQGAAKLSRRIATIRARLNLPQLTNEVTDLLLKRTDRRFETQTDPDGRPWPALKPSTIKRKAREGTKRGALQRTGKLRASIKRVRAAAGATFISTGAEARIGIEDPEVAAYARRHQQGFGVPVRRFLGVGALDVKAVDSLLRRKARELDTGD